MMSSAGTIGTARRIRRCLAGLVVLLAVALISLPLRAAERADATGPERDRIGWGWLLSNDALGDGQDRWRTGALSLSQSFGPGWRGTAPGEPGRLLELRFRAEILQPGNLMRYDPTDRRYAGIVSLGLHNHVQRGGNEITFGGDLVLIGPQTRMDDVQSALHGLVGGAEPSTAVRAAQIDDRLRPTAVLEYGRRFGLAPTVTLRPFAEARLGDESLARFGADLVLGTLGQGGLRARDAATGHRYDLVPGDGAGLSLIVGGDTAYVTDSVYLPSGNVPALSGRRDRLRAGLSYSSGDVSMFYGVTWLGEEYDTQPQGQLIGSLQVQLRF